MDNDVDTDDEQISSGIRRLHQSLYDAVEEQKNWEAAKDTVLKLDYL